MKIQRISESSRVREPTSSEPAAARQHLAAIEREISCPLVREPAIDAVILSCGHAFSEDALQSAISMIGGKCPYECATALPAPRKPHEAMREVATWFVDLCPNGVEAASNDTLLRLRNRVDERPELPKQFDRVLARSLMPPPSLMARSVGFVGDALSRAIGTELCAAACIVAALIYVGDVSPAIILSKLTQPTPAEAAPMFAALSLLIFLHGARRAEEGRRHARLNREIEERVQALRDLLAEQAAHHDAIND